MATLLLSACATTVPTATTPPTPSTSRPTAPAEVRAPVTILVSIDGLHPDYLKRGASPNLNALAQGGVFAQMRPSFPSKTFPNHYTIVTGKRPDNNGIVDNNMRDARRPGPNENFSMGNTRQSLDPFWWDEAEPLWVTAERQGVRTATMFWPGSEVAIRGQRPQDWQRFDQNVSNPQRVNVVLDWLRRPANSRPKFVTLYFDTLDMAAHRNAPDSPEVNKALTEIDQQIGYLVSNAKSMGQPVNIVIVSDHGMAATSEQRLIDVDKLLPRDAYQLVTTGPIAGFNPLPGREAQVEAALVKPAAPHQNMECWYKKDIPPRFQYGKNPRVPAVFCLAKVGWNIVVGKPEYSANGGNHGYDNMAPEMMATFIANGPEIAKGKILPTFDNVDVYPLLAYLIGVQPLPYDGVPHLPAETRNPNLPASAVRAGTVNP